MTIRDALMDAIEAENENLREENRQLREMLGFTFEAPPVFGLTGKECKVFGSLMKRDIASKEFIMNCLYLDGVNDAAEIKIVDVFICKIRAKLKPFDVTIETQWGQGYYMTAENKAKAMTLMPQRAAA